MRVASIILYLTFGVLSKDFESPDGTAPVINVSGDLTTVIYECCDETTGTAPNVSGPKELLQYAVDEEVVPAHKIDKPNMYVHEISTAVDADRVGSVPEVIKEPIHNVTGQKNMNEFIMTDEEHHVGIPIVAQSETPRVIIINLPTSSIASFSVSEPTPAPAPAPETPTPASTPTPTSSSVPQPTIVIQQNVDVPEGLSGYSMVFPGGNNANAPIDGPGGVTGGCGSGMCGSSPFVQQLRASVLGRLGASMGL